MTQAIIQAPQRVQRQRVKGCKLPLDQNGEKPILVNRGTLWGNPFVCKDKAIATELFGDLLRKPYDDLPDDLFAMRRQIEVHRTELRGRNLACFCPSDGLCHGDRLVEWGNFIGNNVHHGVNRAAFVWRLREGESPASLGERFALSDFAVLDLMERYRGVTIWKSKSEGEES